MTTTLVLVLHLFLVQRIQTEQDPLLDLGSLFAIGGAAEAVAVVEPGIGLFTFSGTATESTTKGNYDGSGTSTGGAAMNLSSKHHMLVLERLPSVVSSPISNLLTVIKDSQVSRSVVLQKEAERETLLDLVLSSQLAEQQRAPPRIYQNLLVSSRSLEQENRKKLQSEKSVVVELSLLLVSHQRQIQQRLDWFWSYYFHWKYHRESNHRLRWFWFSLRNWRWCRKPNYKSTRRYCSLQIYWYCWRSKLYIQRSILWNYHTQWKCWCKICYQQHWFWYNYTIWYWCRIERCRSHWCFFARYIFFFTWRNQVCSHIPRSNRGWNNHSVWSCRYSKNSEILWCWFSLRNWRRCRNEDHQHSREYSSVCCYWSSGNSKDKRLLWIWFHQSIWRCIYHQNIWLCWFFGTITLSGTADTDRTRAFSGTGSLRGWWSSRSEDKQQTRKHRTVRIYWRHQDSKSKSVCRFWFSIRNWWCSSSCSCSRNDRTLQNFWRCRPQVYRSLQCFWSDYHQRQRCRSIRQTKLRRVWIFWWILWIGRRKCICCRRILELRRQFLEPNQLLYPEHTEEQDLYLQLVEQQSKTTNKPESTVLYNFVGEANVNFIEVWYHKAGYDHEHLEMQLQNSEYSKTEFTFVTII